MLLLCFEYNIWTNTKVLLNYDENTIGKPPKLQGKNLLMSIICSGLTNIYCDDVELLDS